MAVVPRPTPNVVQIRKLLEKFTSNSTNIFKVGDKVTLSPTSSINFMVESEQDYIKNLPYLTVKKVGTFIAFDEVTSQAHFTMLQKHHGFQVGDRVRVLPEYIKKLAVLEQDSVARNNVLTISRIDESKSNLVHFIEIGSVAFVEQLEKIPEQQPILTSEEFIDLPDYDYMGYLDNLGNIVYTRDELCKLMKKFAQYHVMLGLDTAAMNANLIGVVDDPNKTRYPNKYDKTVYESAGTQLGDRDVTWSVNRASILGAYEIDKIE